MVKQWHNTTIDRRPVSSHLRYLDVVVQRRSVKKVFLKISQNSRESTCVRVSSFTKIAGLLKSRL